ncbi:MAG: serine protease DegQ [Pseudohongiellaceae bacterium]|jgi:serine protease DegQ
MNCTKRIISVRRSSGLLVLLLTMLMSNFSYGISKEALQAGFPSLAPMLEKSTQAVVNIRVTKRIPANAEFSLGENVPNEVRRFFESRPDLMPRNRQQPLAIGAGSGVIIDAEQGYIITNHHVVDGASNISVQLSDQRVIEASLIGSDQATDIALLQIPGDDLVDIKLADIESVQVGDYVVAIGNPFGIGQTVTSGIVSALGRAGLNNQNYEDFIQTDASINVGNSGGALVDLEGRLVGINTAIISDNGGGSNGIGFAVPSDMVARVIEHLQRDGEVRRGILGVTIATATPEIIASLGVDLQEGAIVTSVLRDSAAQRAGVQVSDIIVEIDGRPIDNSRELRNTVGLLRQGKEVDLVLYRNGEKTTLQTTIGGTDPLLVSEEVGAGLNQTLSGARLRSVTPTSDGIVEPGLLVEQIDSRSQAALAGLQEGDIIVQVNRVSVSSLDSFNAAIQDSDRFSAVTVVREERQMLLFIPRT